MAPILLQPSPPASVRPPAAPRWATPRRSQRHSYGRFVAEAADLLGKPLRPWQRDVVDVALEVDADTGRLAYREVVLTVPRQQGKSTLLLAVMVQRALGFAGHSPQRMTYAAQTGVAARKKFLKDYAEELTRSPIGSWVSVTKGNGHEEITFANGSSVDITAATEKAGHGATLDLAFIDEAFAYADARLEQAFLPAQSTRPQPQTWVVSTAGTQDSIYLRNKVDRGRAMVEAGADSSTAYFEWSAAEDADPSDPATWWACMPSLGHGISQESVQHAFDTMELDEFARAYLNQWRYGKTAQQVIDPDHWAACLDAGDSHDQDAHPGMELDLTGGVALAVDVSPSRTAAAICEAGLTGAGYPGVEVIESGEGTDWVVPRVLELVASNPYAVVVLDAAGPAGSLLTDLAEAGLVLASSGDVVRDGAHGQVVTTSRADMTAACGQLYDAACQRRLRHRGQVPLDAALAGAARRRVGDAWAWGRRASSADITPLVAATIALWAHGRYVRAAAKAVPFENTFY